MGEGSVLRAATISRFRLIWKGGRKGREDSSGGCGGHPGPISHPWAALGTPLELERKVRGRAYDTHLLYPPQISGSHLTEE